MVGCLMTSHTATQLTTWGRALDGQRGPAGLQLMLTLRSVDRYVPSPNAEVWEGGREGGREAEGGREEEGREGRREREGEGEGGRER